MEVGEVAQKVWERDLQSRDLLLLIDNESSQGSVSKGHSTSAMCNEKRHQDFALGVAHKVVTCLSGVRGYAHKKRSHGIEASLCLFQYAQNGRPVTPCIASSLSQAPELTRYSPHN